MEEQDARETPRTQDAESRFATIVKFDIVDSTRLARKISRPDSLELRRGFRAAVESVVKPFDVKIEWEGDGGLILFGYPEVRVDAAEAAVRSGLTLIDAVGAVDAVPGVRLELRVGIASGFVTIDLLSGALESMAINKAERLKTTAGPNEVVVADDTRRLVRNFFEYADLGTFQLKGFDEPTRVWRVMRESAVVSRFAAQRQVDSPGTIIGRADTLARLSNAWADALGGHGAAVCLVGDAGMGKSRLARATLDRAEQDGAVVLEIQCTPSTGNSPLLPIGVLLRRTARIGATASELEKEEHARALLARLLGEHDAPEAFEYLAPLFGMQSAPIPIDKTREQVRRRTIESIVAIVRALAAQSPLAVLCEDLHWADDSTAQVVQNISQAIGELRALMIVTRWPRPVTPIDFEAVTASFTTIAVEPLRSDNAADLVRAVAQGGLTSERIDEIVSRCGGVPLLLEEVTRSTIDQADAGAAAPVAHRSSSSVPPELQLVVESRLGRWPNLKGIIEAASVLGREFSVGLLESLLPERRAEVADALALFTDQGLFAQPESRAGGRASFRHGLLRDAVYETLVSRDYLRRLHSRAADMLIASYMGTPDASPDVLAQHLRLAERLVEAIRVRLSAGEDTFKRGAYVEANGHCEAARSLIGEVGASDTVKNDALKLYVLLGMVGTGIHGYSAKEAEVAYREALGMFDESTVPAERYPVTRGLATGYLVRGDLPTAHRYAQEGLELAQRANRPDYLIDAMSVLAYTTLYFGRLADSRSWIDRCLNLYDAEHGETFRYPVPQDAKTAALALLPTAAWLLGDAEGAEDAIARGLKHIEHLGRDFDTALLHAWTAGTRYTQRRYLDALQHAGIAYALGKEHQFQEWEGVGGMMALLSQSALQPSADAVGQAIAAGQAFNAKGIGLNASYFLWGIARGLVTAGNVEGAAAMLDAALQAGAASQETRMNPEVWILKAEIEPDRAKALRLLMDAYSLAEAQGAVANALRASIAIVMRMGDDAMEIDRARQTLDLLDGRVKPDPGTPHWMQESLASTRTVVEKLRPMISNA